MDEGIQASEIEISENFLIGEELKNDSDDLKWYKRVLNENDLKYVEEEKEKLANIYYGRDKNVWT